MIQYIQSNSFTNRNHNRGLGLAGRSAAILLVVVLSLLSTACPKTNGTVPAVRMTRSSFVQLLQAKAARSDFETEVKRIIDQRRQDYFILERPSYDGEEVMKIAVLYRKPKNGVESPLLPPVGVIPGFTAGGFLYLQYTRDLVDAGYVVFLPDIKGDYLHVFGLELFVDPLIDPNFNSFSEHATVLEEDLREYTGEEEIGPKEVFQYYKALYNAEIDDQALADLYRKDMFAYRGYSLDVVVNAMFDVNEDPDSPLYGIIDTDNIGLEAHSLGPDEVVESIVKRDGEWKYWWSDRVKVALLKGAVPTLQRTANFETIDTPVIFMVGEYDSAEGVLGPTWQRFNVLHAPTAYIKFYDSGHVLFIDPPIGFLGDKILPFFGNFKGVTLPTFRRNKADVSEISVLVYDAYLRDDADALQALKDGTLDFVGEYSTRNM